MLEYETKKFGSNSRIQRDTLEDFQGKVMACMVLGIPMKVAKKWRRFDTSMILEIIHEYGTTAETLGFHEGTFTPQCGGLQGGPRSPGEWGSDSTI
jgi:hypothetical protein